MRIRTLTWSYGYAIRRVEATGAWLKSMEAFSKIEERALAEIGGLREEDHVPELQHRGGEGPCADGSGRADRIHTGGPRLDHRSDRRGPRHRSADTRQVWSRP